MLPMASHSKPEVPNPEVPVKSNSFNFEIKGEVPAKKNSYRYSAHGLYKPASISGFEETVHWTLKELKAPYLKGVINLHLTFFTATNGDLDNKVTTLLDALQDNGAGGLFKNDRDVVNINAFKFKCPKKEARVVIKAIGVYADSDK